MPNKIDSNRTGLAFAEETIGSPKTLPGSPVWYGLEPNSYKDFGGEFKQVARDPINPSRQRAKGTLTDLDASGGYNEDLTQNNSIRLARKFLFAVGHEPPSTKPYDGTQVAITSVEGSTNFRYNAASGLGGFLAKTLVFASGFTNSANNGLKKVASSAAGNVTIGSGVVAEASPPAAAKLVMVGVEFDSGDATLTAAAANLTLGTTSFNLTTLPLYVGQWVFIGGDAAGTQFASNSPGYARIYSIAAGAIVFDKTTWTPASSDGSGKTIRMFFGKFIRNELDPSLIIAGSVQLERQLGNDGNGIQSEYLPGSFASELTINIPKADKVTVDYSFMSMDYETRDGTTGVKSGTRVAALGENAFNTSRNVYRMRVAVLDPTTLNPTPLFGYITEGKITINNNLSVAKAVSVFGGFDVTAGTFEVGGSATAYFTTVAATSAIKNYSDVTMDFILAARNAGIVYDLGLIGLGGGKLTIEKDQPVMMPLTTPAYQCPAGYTLGVTYFDYLPTAAMPA